MVRVPRPGLLLLFLVVLAVQMTLSLAVAAQEPPAAPAAPVQEERPTAEELIREGMEMFDEDDYETALVKFDAAVAADPRNPAAYMARFVTKAWLGDKAGAAADRERALALAEQAKLANPDYDVPKLVQAWVSRVEGQVEIRALNFPGAVPLFEKAVELYPRDAIAHGLLADALMYQQMNSDGWSVPTRTTESNVALEKAMGLLRENLSANPNSEAHRGAKLWWELNFVPPEDPDRALRLLAEILSLYPNSAYGHVTQGSWLLFQKNDKNRGLKALQKGRELARAEITQGQQALYNNFVLALASQTEGFHRLGRPRYHAGNYKMDQIEASTPLFEEAVRLSPLYAGFLLNRCKAARFKFFSEKNREKSAAYLRQALECLDRLDSLAPNSPSAAYERAVLPLFHGFKLFREKRRGEEIAKYKEALAKLDEFIQRYPRDAAMRHLRAQAQYALGYVTKESERQYWFDEVEKSAAQAIMLSGDPNYANLLLENLAYKRLGWGGAFAMALAGMSGMATGNVAAANMAMITEMQRQQAQLEAEVAAMKAAAGVPAGPARQRSVLEDLSMVFLQIAAAVPEMQRQAQAEIDATRQMVLDAQAEGQRRQAIEEEAKQKAIEEEQKKKDAQEEALRRQQQASAPPPSPQQSQPQQQRGGIEDILGNWCMKGRSCSAANLTIGRSPTGGYEGRLTILFTQMNRTYSYRLKNVRLRAGTDSLFDYEVDCTNDPREVARAEGWMPSYLSYYPAMSEPEQIYYYGECHPLDDWMVWRRPGSN